MVILSSDRKDINKIHIIPIHQERKAENIAKILLRLSTIIIIDYYHC